MAPPDAPGPGRLSADEILAYLNRATEPPSLPADQVRAYRAAAAVLASIPDLSRLRPAFPAPAGKAAELLAPDLMPVNGRALAGGVTLRPEVRTETVRELVASGAVDAALAANPVKDPDPLQAQLERYLRGQAPPLERQTLAELDATLQVSVWLAGARAGVPSAAQVQRRAGYLRLLAPFETLAGDTVFQGRRKEMDQLRRYVGVVAPESAAVRAIELVTRWAMPERQPAVVIWGMGGAGKSSLVARFMLEHTRQAEPERIPFGYLDFARSGLDIGDPVDLSRELLRQLDLQFPHLGLAGGFASLLRDRQADDDEAPPRASELAGRAQSVLADILGILGSQLGPRPYVIVLDTFEEVQYRGEERAYPFWRVLSDLQERWPFLRVVVAGRAPVDSLRLAGRRPHQIELGELDDEAAAAFLRAQGIIGPEAQRDLIDTFGRLPLSLRLVSSLVARTPGGVSALVGPGADGLSLVAASDEVTQAGLFGRILDHIADPRVRRLAHPGLMLRRINPEIILNVLNGPCGLGITTIAEATELFEGLRRETSLVAVDSADGDLVHRAELRRVMLKMLLSDAPGTADAINRRAVEWYEAQAGQRARAEFVYHWLHLGHDRPAEDSRVAQELRDPQVRASVQASIDEFGVQTQLWLAAHGLDVPDATLEQASRDQAHAAVAAQVEELLPYGEEAEAEAGRIFSAAFSSLRADGLSFSVITRSLFGRVDRAASPVFLAGARLAAQRGDDDTALRLIEEGLERAARDGAAELTLGLLKERAWLSRARPPAAQAEGLALLADHARRHRDADGQIQQLAQSIDGRLAGVLAGGGVVGRGTAEPDPATGPADSPGAVMSSLGLPVNLLSPRVQALLENLPDLATLARLIIQAGPQALWGLLPALRSPVDLARTGANLARAYAPSSGIDTAALQWRPLDGALRSLVTSPASPFQRTAFPGPRSQAALDGLLGVADAPEDGANGSWAQAANFLDAFVRLCDAWPYRVLYVTPPYGRRGESLSTGTE